MAVNEELLGEIIKTADSGEFQLRLAGRYLKMTNVTVSKVTNPVDGPTTRGGVYTTDKFSYRLKGTINDISIIPELTKTMLGPNTDFGKIEIITKLGDEKKVSLFTNLTNSMHNSQKIELNLVIVDMK